MSAVLEKVRGTISGANGRSPGVAGVVTGGLLQVGPVGAVDMRRGERLGKGPRDLFLPRTRGTLTTEVGQLGVRWKSCWSGV